MKKTSSFIILAISAIFFVACGAPPANNSNANSNANTAKPTAAAPTADALLALEKQAQEAYTKGDGKFFEGMLSDKAMMSMGKDRMDKAGIVKMISTAKCEGATVNLSEPQMSKINDDTYAFTYKNASTGKCSEGADGKMTDLKPTRAATVWVRNADKWQAAWHSEDLIIDPKAAPAAPAAPPAKEEAKKEEPKKEGPKKEEPKKDDKAAANSNNAAAPAPAKPVADPNTEALVKLHTSGWEAFKNKDAKAFDALLTADMTNVDPLGGVVTGKANVIKNWTETMKCEGITKVSVANGFASAISPTVELFTLTGTADGKCDGQPNGPLDQTTVYVKEGDAWKLAFMFESIPMPGK